MKKLIENKMYVYIYIYIFFFFTDIYMAKICDEIPA